jgi:hypothetical protein
VIFPKQTERGWTGNQKQSNISMQRIRLLALCKFVRLIKQMTEVTYKPTLELGTSLLSSERALSCHLVFLWQSMARFSLFLGGFYKFVGKEGGGHSGLWSRISEKE